MKLKCDVIIRVPFPPNISQCLASRFSFHHCFEYCKSKVCSFLSYITQKVLCVGLLPLTSFHSTTKKASWRILQVYCRRKFQS